MKIKLYYGKSGLEFNIDDALSPAVFRKKRMTPAACPDCETTAALARPIASPPLREIAAGKSTACIVINDITRPVPNKILLPPIIKELTRAGLLEQDIFLLNATGTHRPADELEQIELVGEEIAARHKFLNHFCHNAHEHTFLGTTAAGTDVHIDSRYLGADVKILTGLIEPHFMAGYSGGRKVICPGVASIETVKSIHHPKFMEAPNARNCNLDSNPLHSELVEISKMAGCDFIVNAVINEDRELCAVFAGGVIEAHAKGVEFACAFDSFTTAEQFDIVITSSAGYPLDRTFYQAVKGICGAAPILKPGGSIIIAAECSEGLGNPSFIDGLSLRAKFTSHSDYISHIEKNENFMPDQWQVEKLSQALETAEVTLVSHNIEDKDTSLTFCRKAQTVEQALDACLQKHGPSAKIAVVPEGPYLIPIFKGALS